MVNSFVIKPEPWKILIIKVLRIWPWPSLVEKRFGDFFCFSFNFCVIVFAVIHIYFRNYFWPFKLIANTFGLTVSFKFKYSKYVNSCLLFHANVSKSRPLRGNLLRLHYHKSPEVIHQVHLVLFLLNDPLMIQWSIVWNGPLKTLLWNLYLFSQF